LKIAAGRHFRKRDAIVGLYVDEFMKGRSDNFILITSSNFPDGGPGANYLNLFCRGLKANGAGVEVYLLKGHAFGDTVYNGPRKGSSPHGIHYTYLGFRQRPKNIFLKVADQFISFSRLQVLLLSLTFRSRKDTILLYNSDLFFNVPVHLVAKTAGIRIVKFAAEIIDKSQYRHSIIGRISRATYMGNFRYLNKMSDKLIVFSEYLRNEFLQMGFDEKKIIVQPNLTDFGFWQKVNAELKYTLGYSGAPYMKDGLSDLLKAVSLLAANNLNITLLVVGDATFGRTLIPGLKAECLKLGIRDRVTFTGLVESGEVKEYLSQCEILAITRPDTVQTRAGFPTKLGEYFALKKPVLATRFGDMERYFTDGLDVIFADCNDAESVALKIEWMITNKKELGDISEKGYETARKLLEYEAGMERILSFLVSD
jgi:glycosyltransferase involved in cell wall biosynthesis